HERWGYGYDDYRFFVDRTEDRSLAAWHEEARLRPTFLEFWYRSSPRPIGPTRRWRWLVAEDDPPLGTAGIATVRLDSRGRLRTLLRPPPAPDRGAVAWSSTLASPPADSPAATDWSPLFEAAELAADDFRLLPPQRAPPFFAERLFAWEGTYAGQAAPLLLVHAATTAGRVVWWQVSERSLFDAAALASPPGRPVLVGLIGFALVLVVGGWLAYRHRRDGRGDRRGARRLALTMGGVTLTQWILVADHLPTTSEFSMINSAIGGAALLAIAVWLLYLALEPYARRRLPRRLTSWTRALAGEIHDPLVGRDLLLGLTAYAAVLAVAIGTSRLTGELGWDFPHGLRPLLGARFVAANVLSIMTLITPLVLMGILVVVRSVVRSDRWAPLAFFLVLLPIDFAVNGVSFLGLLTALCLAVLAAYVGLLALLGFAFVAINLYLVPVSLDPSHWWAANSWIGIGAVLALAVWSYRTATRAGGRRAGEPD
ncbi:MAG: hypothetical protein ACE5EG_05195, partial [Thermoanaerobaculia bacterium]